METPTELGPKPKSNLERIKVPQFSGNIKNYRTWKRIFKDTMSRNSQDEGSRLARLIEAIQPPRNMKLDVLLQPKQFGHFSKNY